jgi:hypothetical protein
MAHEDILERTIEAPMRAKYGEMEWAACARVLTLRGLSADETVRFLMSPLMHTVDEKAGSGKGEPTDAGALTQYLWCKVQERKGAAVMGLLTMAR